MRYKYKNISLSYSIMGGGIIQLVSLGNQENYLVSNPQYSFFKSVYRRHTNFSIEAVEQHFNTNPSVESTILTSKISKNGDMIYRMWVDATLYSEGFSISDGQTDVYSAWTNSTGYALIKECEISIGGQKIDSHNSVWLDIYNELTDHDNKEWIGVNKHASKNLYLETSETLPNLRLYVPLKFWFCKKASCSIPLVAINYHDVELKITTRDINSLINTNANTTGATPVTKPPDIRLWVDYVHLDDDERRRISQTQHEYLIEQVKMEEYPAKLLHKINFTNPVKELIWVVQNNNVRSEKKFKSGVTNIDAMENSENSLLHSNDYFCYQTDQNNVEEFYGYSQKESFSSFKLLLNNTERFPERKASYFRLCQPIQAGHNLPSKHIYLYSFALKPEEHQPSGSCNFSTISDIKMSFKGNLDSNSTISVFAINYNILRISSGMGGIVYTGIPDNEGYERKHERPVKKKKKTHKKK